MTPRERVVIHLRKHGRMTCRELAMVAGVPLTDVKRRSFARLVFDLRIDGVLQVTTSGLRSEFVLGEPDMRGHEEAR